MLSALGITRWRLRTNAPEPKSETKPTKRLPRLIVLADAAQADKDLLSKIIQALKLQDSDCEIHWVNEPEDLRGSSWPNLPLLAFGESLTPYLPADAIQSMGLSLLAENLPAKKVLWNRLKALV